MKEKILTGMVIGCLAFVSPAYSQDDSGPDVSELRTKAEQGDAEAQYALGAYYFRRGGALGAEPGSAENDNENGVKWTRMAAEQGNADAQSTIGFRYYKGNGVAQDTAEAKKWLLKAAEQDHRFAQNNLCNWYGDQMDIWSGADEVAPVILPLEAAKVDVDEAEKWCGTAARNGFLEAQSKYALLNARGTAEVAPDYEEAYFWFSVQRRPPQVRQEIEKRITADRALEIREKASAWRPETDAPKP